MLPDPFRMLCTIHKQKHSVSSFQLSVCILCVLVGELRAALSTHLHMFFYPKRTYLGLHTDPTYQNRMVDPMQTYQVSLIGCTSRASLGHTLVLNKTHCTYLMYDRFLHVVVDVGKPPMHYVHVSHVTYH